VQIVKISSGWEKSHLAAIKREELAFNLDLCECT
jgi:hypothetical protein